MDIQKAKESINGFISSNRQKLENILFRNNNRNNQKKKQPPPPPLLTGIVCQGANAIPSQFLQDSILQKYNNQGKPLTTEDLEDVINSVNGWYRDRGLFGFVSGKEVLPGSQILELKVTEAEVNDITLRFFDRVSGKPIAGKTRSETIVGNLRTKKGQIYNVFEAQKDVMNVMDMGIMEDVSMIPQPVDSGKVDLVMNLVEGVNSGFSPDVGFSTGDLLSVNGLLSGVFGRVSYYNKNLFGKNQKMKVLWKGGKNISTYGFDYKDPWSETNEKSTSKSIMVQSSRAPETLVFGYQLDNSCIDIDRLTAGVGFGRRFGKNWRGTAGLSYQRSGAFDSRGNLVNNDSYGNPVSASGNGYDNTVLAKLESTYSESGQGESRNLVLSMEQGLPLVPEWMRFNRVNVDARKEMALGLSSRLRLSFSGGHMVGNFPPHEAFAIGGLNSVRGYEEGDVGSGRSYVVGSGEISTQIYGPVSGVVFADCGSDLRSGSSVLGDPAGARAKPGRGFGYGIGVHVDTPLAPLRLEFAFNGENESKFHVGLGHRN